MTTRRPHADGLAALDAIVAEFGIEDLMHELRRFAINHLSAEMPDLEEIGSSDVSIHLAQLANYRPELLRAEAERLRERNELVRRIAEITGETFEQTLSDMQRLMAPAEDRSEGKEHGTPTGPSGREGYSQSS